jgi:hypothetical protein
LRIGQIQVLLICLHFMPETDLYVPVKRFLERQGFAVKGEIGACDIVAVRGEEPPVIVELKATFSLQLVLQGIDRQAMTDWVYLAVPPPKRGQHGDVVKLCRRLGLGLLLVSGQHVEALLDPAPYQPRKMKVRTAQLLKEFSRRVGDTTMGGSARGIRMTAYRQDALRCLVHLEKHGPAAPKAIKAATGTVKAPAILQDDVYGWFQRVERGVYGLSLKGQAAVTIFDEAIKALSNDVTR